MSTGTPDDKMEPQQVERLTVYISPDLRHALKVVAAMQGKTLTRFVSDALSTAVSACETFPGHEAFAR